MKNFNFAEFVRERHRKSLILIDESKLSRLASQFSAAALARRAGCQRHYDRTTSMMIIFSTNLVILRAIPTHFLDLQNELELIFFKEPTDYLNGYFIFIDYFYLIESTVTGMFVADR